MNLANVIGSLTRWRLRLFELNFNVVHGAGIKHQAADALLRLPAEEVDNTPLEDMLPVFKLRLKDLE